MFQVEAIGQCHPPDKSEEAGFHVIQLQFQTAPQDTAWSHALLELQIHDQNKDCCFQAIKSEVVCHLGIDNRTSFFQIIFDSYLQKSASTLLPSFLLLSFNFSFSSLTLVFFVVVVVLFPISLSGQAF